MRALVCFITCRTSGTIASIRDAQLLNPNGLANYFCAGK
jgi:hypothetical protein